METSATVHDLDRDGICRLCGANQIEIRVDAHADLKKRCVGALGEAGLISLLADDPSIRLRELVARALGIIGTKTAIDILVRTLDGPDTRDISGWELSQRAVVSLIRIGGPEACSALVRAIEHPGSYHHAILGRGYLRCAEAVQPLIEVLHSSQNYQAREDACYALADISDILALESLLHALDDSSQSVSRAAVRAVAKIFHSAGLDNRDRERVMAEARRRKHLSLDREIDEFQTLPDILRDLCSGVLG